MRHVKLFENFIDDDGDEIKPIGISSFPVEGINGLVHIFSPLESDMVDDWNSDVKIQEWVRLERVLLQEIKYDEWSIWGIEGDKQVSDYVMKKYSW